MVDNVNKEYKIKMLLNEYQNMSYIEIYSLVFDIFSKILLASTKAIYKPQNGNKFYRVLKVNKDAIMDYSFFYERKKEIDKIKIERFNLQYEPVLYLSESIPSTLIRECDLKLGDEIILVEYELREELNLLNFGDFSIYRELGIDNRIVDLMEKVIKQKKKIENDYYLTNAIKEFFKKYTNYEGVYYLSTHQTTERELRNVCLYKGVGEKKLKVLNVYRGTFLNLTDENNNIKNTFNIENFFAMKLEKMCSKFEGDEILWEEKDTLAVATINCIVQFKIPGMDTEDITKLEIIKIEKNI